MNRDIQKTPHEVVERVSDRALRLWLLGLMVGVAIGLVVAALRFGVDALELLFIGSDTGPPRHPALRAAGPAIGGLLVASLLWAGGQMGWGARPRPFDLTR
jgi:hypothetical protein